MTSQTSGTLPFPCHQDVLIRSQGLPGLCGLCLRSRKAGGGDGGESWEPRGEMERPCFPPSWRCILQKFRMLHMESMQANHGAPGLQFNSRLGEPVERKGGPSSVLRAWLACLFVSTCVAWHVQVSGESVGDACALPVSQGKC